MCYCKHKKTHDHQDRSNSVKTEEFFKPAGSGSVKESTTYFENGRCVS